MYFDTKIYNIYTYIKYICTIYGTHAYTHVLRLSLDLPYEKR